MLLRTLGLASVLLAFAFPAPAAPQPPHVTISQMADLPVVTMVPYDEHANANAAVDAAFARAKKSGKRVLIDLGGNWCTDCIVLSNIMALPEVKKFLDAHYEVVDVNVGRFDANLQIPARFGITKRLAGVPSILIADPDGKLVDAGHVSALADARSMTPQGIADWLAQWAK